MPEPIKRVSIGSPRPVERRKSASPQAALVVGVSVLLPPRRPSYSIGPPPTVLSPPPPTVQSIAPPSCPQRAVPPATALHPSAALRPVVDESSTAIVWPCAGWRRLAPRRAAQPRRPPARLDGRRFVGAPHPLCIAARQAGIDGRRAAFRLAVSPLHQRRLHPLPHAADDHPLGGPDGGRGRRQRRVEGRRLLARVARTGTRLPGCPTSAHGVFSPSRLYAPRALAPVA